MGKREKIKSKFHRDRKERDEEEAEAKEQVETVDPNEPKVKNALYILKIIRWETCSIFLGVLGAAAVGALPILLYLVLGNLIDGLTPATTTPTSSIPVQIAVGVRQSALFQTNVNRSAMWLAIVAAGAFAAALVQNFFLNLSHDRIGNHLKTAYFNSLLDQEIGYFDRKQTGSLVNEMTESMEVIQDAFTTKFGEFAKNCVQCILGVILALVAGWRMALVMISCAPLLALLLGGSGMLVRVFTKKIGGINSIAANIANEVISSIRTVRSMDGEEKEKRRFARALRRANPTFLMKAIVLGLCIAAAIGSIWGVVALAFWYGGRLVVRGQQTTGELFQVFGFVIMSVLGLAQALQILPDFGKSHASIMSLLKVIKREPVLKPSGGTTPNKLEGHIEFRNVNFSYPTRPDVQVLTNFSLTIKPGQAVALVGASGSGKSTVVGLIEKFYVPDSGEIILDGVPLNEIDPRWLHRNIGIVTQEPTLFATTIKKNITYAVEDAGREVPVTDEDIERAARAANAHDFIMALPEGYNTKLGERGVSLSGGQKQRIAIARAMIQDPSLLLLDEATSALDTQSEALVQEALTRLMQGRTSIVIAHRLSTVVESDMICVLNKGELKEKGTHSELLQIADGYYFKLAAKQMMFGQTRSDLPPTDASDSDLEERIIEVEEDVDPTHL